MKLTQGFSGAEVVACVQEAAMQAVEQDEEAVGVGHLEFAIERITPQITEEMLRYYKEVAKLF